MSVALRRLRPDPDRPPPGPFRPAFWRSPLRGPWLTSMLGLILLVLVTVVAVTGLASNAAYEPRLGGNALGRHLGPLDFYLFRWPTSPAWLYAATQGLHVTLGLAAIPVLGAKLWSVIPRLFDWPPARSPAQALERLSVLLLVGGALFEFATGAIDIQVYYPFHFFFTDAHYYGAWVFLGAFAFHVAMRLPFAARQVRLRGALGPLRESLSETSPEPASSERDGRGAVTDALVPASPAPPTLSRRGMFAFVGSGSLLLGFMGAGQSIGGPLRGLALLAPRGRTGGKGPNAFQVNRTAAAAQIDPADTASDWRLMLRGRRRIALSRAQLLALTQHTYDLPIACVEGWSTTQRWTGVRLRDLARVAGYATPVAVTATSLEQDGVFSEATLSADQVADPRALLALRVNGVDLSLDHGFPARVIVPALPGVHCTKWVARLSFGRA